MHRLLLSIPLLWSFACPPVRAQTLDDVLVRAPAPSGAEIPVAASEGEIPASRIAGTALLRPAATLELVPGMVVTQHAGDGKANQYFLRGFNLDHGTDFATWVAGVPVNMPSHAHGQGYTDLNFLIPELVSAVRYRKGPYHAEDGDFSSAGSARIDLARSLAAPLAQLTAGPDGYARSLLAGSPAFGPGRLLYGLELFHNDGPWRVPQHYRKVNGVLRYSEGTAFDGFTLTAMAYRGGWTSTDQIPQRAIGSGLVDRFGSLDDTTGGRTHRYSLSGDWSRRGAGTLTRAGAWWLHSGLDLWSNFQYCLADFAASGTCDAGDQFRQTERRTAAGFAASHTVATAWAGRELVQAFGVQVRHDRVAPLGLHATSGRETLAVVREDRVAQSSVALWAHGEVRWNPWLRSIAGLRGDAYAFDVASGLAPNSGRARDAIVSPKLSLVLGPWAGIELFLNNGRGFHSNDARGTTITVDPVNPAQAVASVRPLVPTRGGEIGLRATPVPGWTSTLVLWRLTSASELVFVGDAGTTEAARPSVRSGVEWTNAWAITPRLLLDADFAWARARFRDEAPEGRHVPGAATAVANVGLRAEGFGSWSGSLRVGYVGPRALIEDASVRSSGSLLASLRLVRRIDARTSVALDVHNLFDRKVDDITYWYASQLRGETVPVFDRHLHPAVPRSLRLTLTRAL